MILLDSVILLDSAVSMLDSVEQMPGTKGPKVPSDKENPEPTFFTGKTENGATPWQCQFLLYFKYKPTSLGGQRAIGRHRN